MAFQAQPPAQPGDAMGFGFDIQDTASHTPMSGLRPAAWLSQHDANVPPINCKQQIATYLGANLFNRAQVDLNTYYVLAMDDEASISVVDPLFGFGGSKLLTLLPLESPGADWAQEKDRLFVTQPEAGKVAVADTRGWKIVSQIATGANPQRVVVSGHHAWVGDARGLTAIDTKTLATTALKIGEVGDVIASDDSDFVFATRGKSVIVADAYAAKVLATVTLEGTPTALGYSSSGKAVYALDAQAGRVYAIDGRKHTLSRTIDVRPGATQLRFAPGGRHALLPNPDANIVQVIDAASDRVVQTIAISDAPDRVSFSDLLAYVRRRDSEIVPMISLTQIGAENAQVGEADFPGGQHALGGASPFADSIVSAPDGPAVLVANPVDRMIYLYKEGMAAPAGGFSTYGRQPRAVMVVDHGLREDARGHYATAVPVKQGGRYDVAMFVDAPRVVACFTADIDLPAKPEAPKVRVVAIDPPKQLKRGETAHLRFAIDAGGKALATDDLRALAFEAPGVWQRRGDTKRLSDGSYEFDFVPPDAGTYYVWLESAALGLSRSNSQFQIYEVD